MPDLTQCTVYGASAFSGCRAMATAYLPEGTAEIPDQMFNGCAALAELKIPSTVTSIGTGALQACTALKEIHLPKGLISVGSMAFVYCSSVKKLLIPASVTSLESDAFTLGNQLVVYCYEGTVAEEVCNHGNMPFVVLPILQDYNADAVCSVADAVWLTKIITEAAGSVPVAAPALDCNSDSLVDIDDVTAYLKGLALYAKAPIEA